ncbi:hypothetical protein JVU11DRAFT_8490 [Chiua virens]|nr:hypothetical protein JVU11DRAFT_8490 [Chiua virens]
MTSLTPARYLGSIIRFIASAFIGVHNICRRRPRRRCSWNDYWKSPRAAYPVRIALLPPIYVI